MLSYFELQAACNFYDSILSKAQLQDVWCNENQIVLEFYRHKTVYLVFQYHKSKAQIVLLGGGGAIPKQKKMLPIVLYIKAHLKNQRVIQVKMRDSSERLVCLTFFSGEIHFQLIPGQVNLAVHANHKTLWLNKPQKIKSQPFLTQDMAQSAAPFVVDFEIELQRYHSFLIPFKQSNPQNRDFESRKRRVIESISQAIEHKQSEIEVLMKGVRDFEQDQDFDKLYGLVTSSSVFKEASADVVVLKQQIYSHIKRVKEKLRVSELRLLEVQSHSSDQLIKEQKSKTQLSQLMRKKQVRARMFEIEGFVVSYSRSGQESLKLLKMAQPWDLWFHIQGSTGAHFILRRNKNVQVSESVLLAVAKRVVALASRSSIPLSNACGDVVLTEVRFVFPIKGATPGLVKYTHHRIMRV